MKLFKSSILLASAVAIGAVFSACDESTLDDFGYALEDGSSAEGLFFPSTNPTALELAKSTTVFNIPVERTGVTDAASYPVEFTTDAPEGVFTFPANVTFAQGETTSSITVNCNLTEQPANSTFKVAYNFGTGVPTYNYGSTKGNLTIKVPAAWGPWQQYDKGICTWNYDLGFLMSGPDPDLPISIRYNQEDETKAQFLIEHWRQDAPLVIDYDRTTGICYIPFGTPTNVKFNVTDVGAVEEYVTDAYTYQMSIGSPVDDLINASTFDEKTGEFKIYVCYYAYDPADGSPFLLKGSFGYETCKVGEFKDYSVSLDYEGVFTSVSAKTFAQFTANVGADATEAKIMISNSMDAQAILDAIEAGDESAVSIGAGEGQSLQIPVTEAGEYIGVIVSYNGEESQDAAAIKFNVILGSNTDPEDENWETYGTGIIVDGWFTAAWTFTTATGQKATYMDLPWTFEMQKHKTTDGLYRMKAPYTDESSVLVGVELNENRAPYNIVIDASNPAVVKIAPQLSGFKSTSDTYGFIPEEDYMGYMGNLAGFATAVGGWNDDQIVAKGWDDSKLEDGIITVAACTFGASLDKFGYTWESNPVGMIALSGGEQQAPAKMYSNMMNLRAKSKVAGMLKICTKSNLEKPILMEKGGLNKRMVVKVK